MKTDRPYEGHFDKLVEKGSQRFRPPQESFTGYIERKQVVAYRQKEKESRET